MCAEFRIGQKNTLERGVLPMNGLEKRLARLESVLAKSRTEKVKVCLDDGNMEYMKLVDCIPLLTNSTFP